MGNLALLKYNNYYNRIIKKESSFLGYAPFMCAGNTIGSNPFRCSFNPADGVETEQIINWDGEAPDYVIDMDAKYNPRINIYNQLLPPTTRVPGTFDTGYGIQFTVNANGTMKFTGGYTHPGEIRKLLYSAASVFLEPGTYLLSGCPRDSLRMELVYVGAAQSVSDATSGTVVGFQDWYQQPQIITISTAGQYVIRYSFFGTYYISEKGTLSRPQIVSLSQMYAASPVGEESIPTIDEILADIPGLENYELGVVLNEGTYNSLNGHCTRWFVIENTRLRTGQWKLTLHRDVVSDYYDNIINAPTFIEKATADESDPAIFNNENMTFNQIKTAETLLKDKTKAAYIVGYISRDVAQTSDESISIEQYSPTADINVSSLAAWEYYSLISSPAKYNVYNYAIYQRFGIFNTYNNRTPSASFAEVREYLNSYHNVLLQDDSNEINDIDGKIIYDSSTGRYYRINVNRVKLSMQTVEPVESTSALGIAIASRTGSDKEIKLEYYCWTAQIQLDKITEQSGLTAKISHTRNHLTDAPYDMFVIPYVDGDIWGKIGSGTYSKKHLSKDFSMRVASAISRQLSGTHLYDIQLLPYFPMSMTYYDDVANAFDMPATEADKTYTIVEGGDTTTLDGEILPIVSVIMWASKSTFSVPLDYSIPVENLKIENETDMYRIVSPNYSGTFQFSAAKNRGVDQFMAECTYLPITPYIHVSPNFKGLYGADYDDARGMICGGDFSLPVVRDQWFNYLYNNKNYQNSFDRGIEHIEINNAYSRQGEIINALTMGIAGTAAGAYAGAKLGGAAGAVAGATIGAVGNAITAAADIERNERLRNENLDYTRDQFGFQLQNIAARPQSLARVTAFNYNNKCWPFLEYFTCSDVEKQALADKIKYNGMTIGRIGTIAEFQRDEPSYIKGQFIRFEGLSDDYHIAVAISAELNKGVFI